MKKLIVLFIVGIFGIATSNHASVALPQTKPQKEGLVIKGDFVYDSGNPCQYVVDDHNFVPYELPKVSFTGITTFEELTKRLEVVLDSITARQKLVGINQAEVSALRRRYNMVRSVLEKSYLDYRKTASN